MNYIKETADARGVDQHIRLDHMVTRATWSSIDATWTVTCRVAGSLRVYTCSFLYLCSGYYSYKGGFAPEFPGLEQFSRMVVHPQQWPKDLDYTDKRVVVIASGATAVTLIPAMAATAKHVTILQRSPSFIVSRPSHDQMAIRLRRVLPERSAYAMVRWKNIASARLSFAFCKQFPNTAARAMKSAVARHDGRKVNLDPHFIPRYEPWDQRICLTPDGDFFSALTSGRASIATDEISRFTRTGISLASGSHLDADVVVTATALNLVAVGEIELEVDGVRIDAAQSFIYKGLMLSGVPNLAWCLGYTNVSWTMRADLSSRYVCKLLNHLDAHDVDYAVPTVEDSMVAEQSVLALQAGYVLRAVDRLPKQGPEAPWSRHQNYFADVHAMRFGSVDDSMAFGTRDRASVSSSIPQKPSLNA
ncbi:FAD-containing monooxygenase EthA [Rhodococcus sp. RD6.2]|uniref:flavin-containing monooxygenase n=1 Tax=Rhodococcus sp. RD6.2 TaxID=260936 RepID=UPI00063B1EA5|nr:FAD-containing monooxygenase EthA [Rhodococcus sp. RD6.2]